MGRNSLNFSFVTGFGENHINQPFHWISKTYGIVPGGWMVSGATGSSLINNEKVDSQLKNLMVAGFPSAKIYIDTINSCNSNEVGIYTLASFAFLTGYLALQNRDVEYTGIPYLAKNSTELKVTTNNNWLYCSNCQGKTTVKLFSLSGKLLNLRMINANSRDVKLINYKKYLMNNPLILFRVRDMRGLIKTGKLTGEKKF